MGTSEAAITTIIVATPTTLVDKAVGPRDRGDRLGRVGAWQPKLKSDVMIWPLSVLSERLPLLRHV
jgi:hypothetical protein